MGGTRNFVIRQKINGQMVDLLPETSTETVKVGDHKLTELIPDTAVETGLADKGYVDDLETRIENYLNDYKESNSTALEEINTAITSNKQESEENLAVLEDKVDNYILANDNAMETLEDDLSSYKDSNDSQIAEIIQDLMNYIDSNDNALETVNNALEAYKSSNNAAVSNLEASLNSYKTSNDNALAATNVLIESNQNTTNSNLQEIRNSIDNYKDSNDAALANTNSELNAYKISNDGALANLNSDLSAYKTSNDAALETTNNSLNSYKISNDEALNNVNEELDDYKTSNDAALATTNENLANYKESNDSALATTNTNLNNYKSSNDTALAATNEELSNYKDANDLRVSNLETDLDNYKGSNDSVIAGFRSDFESYQGSNNSSLEDVQATLNEYIHKTDLALNECVLTVHIDSELEVSTLTVMNSVTQEMYTVNVSSSIEDYRFRLNKQTYIVSCFNPDGQARKEVECATDEVNVSFDPDNFELRLEFDLTIDESNLDPSQSVTLSDSTLEIINGDIDATYFYANIKPCIFKNGEVQYYLDKDDFTKKEDGTDADITSGNDGDVMIEIPKVYWKLSKSGSKVNLSISNCKLSEEYKCLAHMRGTEEVDKIYVGAYLGYYDGTKLRSLSGKTITTNQNIEVFRMYASANGSNYGQLTFYVKTLIQMLYLFKFKSLDAQTALGKGRTSANEKVVTGGTNSKEFTYGSSDGTEQMRLFGMEDFWGNTYQWLDGITYASGVAKIGTSGYNNDGDGYTEYEMDLESNEVYSYIKKVQGTTEKGFFPSVCGGSSSTYYCDYVTLISEKPFVYGGCWQSGSEAGIFMLRGSYGLWGGDAQTGARLVYI